MKTLHRKNRRTKSAAIAAMFFAIISSTTIARGQISWVKNITGAGGSGGYFNDPLGVAVSASGHVDVGVGHRGPGGPGRLPALIR